MTLRRDWLLGVVAAAALAGCGNGGSSSTADDPTTGTTTFKFSLSKGAKESSALVDPLKGTVYGALYLSEDVAATGPIQGAMEQGSVEVKDVDLTMADVSAETWTSGELTPGQYTFLGFYDVDGNGDMSKSPDAGDPVTLPSANKVEIAAGEETPLTIVFDFILN